MPRSTIKTVDFYRYEIKTRRDLYESNLLMGKYLVDMSIAGGARGGRGAYAPNSGKNSGSIRANEGPKKKLRTCCKPKFGQSGPKF